MRKSFGLLSVALLCIALVTVVWWIFCGPPEPVYHDGNPLGMNVCDEQPLSLCLDTLVNDHNPMNNEQGAEAVRGIGTNAIPFLLPMLQEHDSELKTRIFELLAQHNFVQVGSYGLHGARLHNYEAVKAFEALGPIASNAIPGLVKIYFGTTNEDLLVNVSDCLAAISPSAAKIVAPKLIVTLSDTDVEVRLSSALALGKFGSNAQMAVPLLISNLNLHTQSFRDSQFLFIRALEEIDPDAAAKWQRANSLNSPLNPKR